MSCEGDDFSYYKSVLKSKKPAKTFKISHCTLHGTKMGPSSARPDNTFEVGRPATFPLERVGSPTNSGFADKLPCLPLSPHRSPSPDPSQLRVCEGPRANYSAEFSCRNHDEYDVWYNYLQTYAKNGTGSAKADEEGEQGDEEEEGGGRSPKKK